MFTHACPGLKHCFFGLPSSLVAYFEHSWTLDSDAHGKTFMVQLLCELNNNRLSPSSLYIACFATR